MNNVSNATDYEKSFIERYLIRLKDEKIKKVEEKISKLLEVNDLEGIKALESRINEIKSEFERDIRLLKEENDEIKKENITFNEIIDFKWKNEGDDRNLNVFLDKCRSVIKKCCILYEIDEKEFEFKIKDDIKINNISIPKYLWNYLFPYQKEGVKWFIDLYTKGKGGILADEMGLGKTLQTIVFLTGLYNTGLMGRVLILCPATVITQWFMEWKKFNPFIRIFFSFDDPTVEGVYIGTYESFKSKIVDMSWNIMILDEGHKIKNKNAQVTTLIKKSSAEYKFILTGTPIQNNLSELWCLFDTINPGLLGSYTSFSEEFEDVINKGGYANASSKTVEKAYQSSVLLRALIEPYILRRLKNQISHNLPSKLDKVVFCSLTKEQIGLYKKILESEHVLQILMGKRNVLSGICLLRKICNHPFLYYKNKAEILDNLDIVESSCKTKIMMELIEKWYNEGHKILIFTQSVKMLDIIEMCINKYNYVRMDGKTAISKRDDLVKKFNDDKNTRIFILTTRVGGLGLNLTSASRIIIYDPDWNPSTDSQAKERSWRYGQTKDVEIYRFICKDTVEEKIYQKQIFKELLGKKVLSKPTLNRFFNKYGLGELFTFCHTSKETEVKVHEEYKKEEENSKLCEVEDRDLLNYKTIKELNEKKILSGKEILEYIRIRESFSESIN